MTRPVKLPSLLRYHYPVESGGNTNRGVIFSRFANLYFPEHPLVEMTCRSPYPLGEPGKDSSVTYWTTNLSVLLGKAEVDNARFNSRSTDEG